MRVLITGAAGYIGQQLLNQLAVQHPQWLLIAADIRPQNRAGMKLNIEPVLLDISQPAAVEDCVATWQPQAIVHLASVVTPPPGMSEAQLHAIDVGGTQALIQAAAAHGVEHLIVTSSGAAYGYDPQNAEWLDEDQPLRAMRSSPTPSTNVKWRCCWLKRGCSIRTSSRWCCAPAPSSANR